MEQSPHHPFYELSLFSGGGGGVLAGHLLGWTTIDYVEIDKYCQQIIAQRIKDEIFKEAPIFTDVREFIQSGAVDEYRGITDVVTAGFPCQPFSVAGKGKGKDDSRNLWPETIEVIRRVRPGYAFLENVPGLLAHKYIGRIFGELAEAGYDARWCVLGADDVGAPHRRKRLWIVAHSNTGYRIQSDETLQTRGVASDDGSQYVAHSKSESGDGSYDDSGISLGREQVSESGNSGGANDVAQSNSERGCGGNTGRKNAEDAGQPPRCSEYGYWNTEPNVGRVVNGVAFRKQRLATLGNGQVPLVAKIAWEILSDPNKPLD